MPRVKRVAGPTKITRTYPNAATLERWQLDYYDASGRRRPKFETRSAADEAKTEIERTLRRTGRATTQPGTVRELCEAWLETLERRRQPPERSTLVAYRAHVHYHIDDPTIGIGGTAAGRLTVAQVHNFKDRLLETRSEDMTRRVLSRLRQALKWAALLGLVHDNVATGIRVTSSGRHDELLEVGENVPTRAEVTRILEAAAALAAGPPSLAEAAIGVLAHCGLRSSELRGLAWRHVDLEAGVIRVRQRADQWMVIGPCKSKHARRTIALPPGLTNRLREWRLVCPRDPEGGLEIVFAAAEGRVFDPTRFRREVWLPALKAAGLARRYTMHSLRHAAVWQRIAAGWPAKRIQQFVGHGSIVMTMDLYGGWWLDEVDEAAEAARLERELTRA